MQELIRGTTPTITLYFDLPASEVSEVYLTLHQGGELLTEKSLADGSVQDKRIIFTLTQVDTLSIAPNRDLWLQVRGLQGSKAFASGMIRTTAEDILKEGKI